VETSFRRISAAFQEPSVFFSDAPSPFDVNFRLFGIPVRVQPMFWLMMALLGSGSFQRGGFELLIIWVACGFVSIMVHELGHALAYRFFGIWSAITLVAFAGLTHGQGSPRHAWQRMLVSAAGPIAGFAFVAAVFGSALVVPWPARNEYLESAFLFLLLQGIFWNLLNLLPIWPLDGGNIAREIFAMLRLRNPDILMHTVSVGTAGLLCAYGIASVMGIPVPVLDQVLGIYRPSLMMTIWLGLFAYQNWQMLQVYQQQRSFYNRYDDDDSPPWRR
jgi:Zn-dependent protease